LSPSRSRRSCPIHHLPPHARSQSHRIHLERIFNVSFIYNWELGRFRPFATIGGGAYFLRRREAGAGPDRTVTKPGGLLGWGGEYYFRTFAVRSEMNVHILSEEKSLPEFDGQTLTAFTWTFGIKVPF
jgi:hypothetical protein